MIAIFAQAVFVYLVATISSVDSFLDHNDDCRHYSAYRDLANLLEHDDCRSAVSVIKTLHKLYYSHGQIHCGNRIIEELAKRYSFDSRTPTSCFCNGTLRLQRYTNDYHRYNTCHRYKYYTVLYDRFFIQQSYPYSPETPCRSHHSVWYELSNVHGHWSTVDGGYSRCVTDLVSHIYDYYHHHSDPCSCTADTKEATRCTQYDSYKKLVQYMEHSQGCISINKVWGYLNHLHTVVDGCRMYIQDFFTNKFNHSSTTHGPLCLCGGHVRNFDNPRIDGSKFYCEHSSAYKDLERKSFSSIETYGCRSLKETWPFFVKIQDFNLGCQTDFIRRAGAHYKTESDDPCTCQLEMTTQISTASSTTTESSSTQPSRVLTDATTTEMIPSTTMTEMLTTQPNIIYSCNKFNVVEAVAQGLPVNSSSDTPNCGTGTGLNLGETNEDLVMAFCDTPSPQNWNRGVKVMDFCESIPNYTPIAAFKTETYSANGASSGIFIGCETDGFRMILQPCNGVPTIQHLNSSGVFLFDPHNYFVIE